MHINLIVQIPMLLSMILIHRAMRIKRYTLLNLFGHRWPNLPHVHHLSWFKRNRKEEMKFTFHVSKCDHIFDELLRLGHIKITHVIPPLEELKRRAYCKFQNPFSHAMIAMFCVGRFIKRWLRDRAIHKAPLTHSLLNFSSGRFYNL